jgi:hypothetical protein
MTLPDETDIPASPGVRSKIFAPMAAVIIEQAPAAIPATWTIPATTPAPKTKRHSGRLILAACAVVLAICGGLAAMEYTAAAPAMRGAEVPAREAAPATSQSAAQALVTPMSAEMASATALPARAEAAAAVPIEAEMVAKPAPTVAAASAVDPEPAALPVITTPPADPATLASDASAPPSDIVPQTASDTAGVPTASLPAPVAAPASAVLSPPDIPVADAPLTSPAADSRPASDDRITPEVMAVLLTRGNALLTDGDVVAARLMYERAARSASAEAAIALGMTYDPRFLAQIGARGVAADTQRAVEWYRRASILGDPQATLLLTQLTAASRK